MKRSTHILGYMSFERYGHIQPVPILNERMPDEITMMLTRDRLPGVGPVPSDNWLKICDVFAAQMRLRDRLIDQNRTDVLIEHSPVSGPAKELLAFTLDAVGSVQGYDVNSQTVTRPDGVEICLKADTPIATLGRLVQEDLLILHPSPKGHVLAEGALCFPSGWTFSEKAGHPLGRIHLPVESYTPDIEKRVQRLFDAIRPGNVLGRANCICHDNYHLFQPYSESEPRQDTSNPAYIRAERQCIFKLPKTGAAVFSIHSYVVKQSANKDL